MKQTCTATGKSFTISEAEQDMRSKLGVPMPTMCPEERHRQRFIFRNERSLYWGKCAATGKRILTMYSPESKVKAYHNDYWWSDKWDTRDYGIDYDFTRPFFDQFREVLYATPHPQLEVELSTMENSGYCNAAANLKNCYWTFNADNDRDCLYCSYVNSCTDCVDCVATDYSELCYQCMDCIRCYNSQYLFDCTGCSDCLFGASLIGCKDCFGCTNMRNKQYCFNNKQLTKDEYEEKVSAILGQYTHAQLLQFFLDFKATQPHKASRQLMCENSTGDHLMQCQNCENCYTCVNTQDSINCIDLKSIDGRNYNNLDISFFGYNVMGSYNCMTVGYEVTNAFGCVNCYNVSDMFYSYFCFNATHDCFGCVGLKKGSYCILNKQYTKEEYYALKDKIIAHMKETGEWGQFFPMSISPFAYNETIAQEYYPLMQSKVQAAGLRWKDQDRTEYQPQTVTILESISDVSDAICDDVLACKVTGKNYKIQKAELVFYKKTGLPVPQKHPDQRHIERIKLRNQRQLYKRKCAVSGTEVMTTYAPDRNEKVLCEVEYLKALE